MKSNYRRSTKIKGYNAGLHSNRFRNRINRNESILAVKRIFWELIMRKHVSLKEQKYFTFFDLNQILILTHGVIRAIEVSYCFPTFLVYNVPPILYSQEETKITHSSDYTCSANNYESSKRCQSVIM